MWLLEVLSRKPKVVQTPASYLEFIENKDFAAALPLLTEAIRHNDARAMAFLGAMTALGLGLKADPEGASAWFRQAAVHGDVSSQTALGLCLASGLGIREDRQEAAYWLYKAGCAGNMKAIQSLAAVADQDPSIIGEHFSEDQLIELVLRWKEHLRQQTLERY
jgi:TPR repeat protein